MTTRELLLQRVAEAIVVYRLASNMQMRLALMLMEAGVDVDETLADAKSIADALEPGLRRRLLACFPAEADGAAPGMAN